MKCSLRALPIVVAVALCCAALNGCTKTRGARAKEGLDTVARESDPKRLLRAGEAYAILGDATRAAQYFALAIENGGDEDAIFPRVLQVCVRDKQYRAALHYGQNYLRKHPEDDGLRFLLASLYGAMGASDTARDEIERVLAASPNNPDAHYTLAVLLRDGDHDLVGADQHFRNYLELQPRGPHASEARASLLKRMP